MTATASGSSPSFQWYIGNPPSLTNPISGATTASYTTPLLTTTTSYWVRATNLGNSTNSSAATISVTYVSAFSSTSRSVTTPNTAAWSPSGITVNGTTFTPATNAQSRGFKDQRVAAHFIIYPQPFGLQGEWTVGKGPELDLGQQRIDTQSLSGGYLQAMFRTPGPIGMLTPYVKYQTYEGGAKFDTNAPHFDVEEVEAGIEWQFRPELELTMAYAHMDRTNVSSAPYRNVDGDLLRMQLQWNY